MYSFDSRVRYSECDEKQHMTIGALMDYLQDCCTFQSEDLGIGIDYLAENHMAWILSSWQVVVKEYPVMGTKITVSTWPYDFERFLGYRNFTVCDENGDVLAYANSVWVFLDTKKGRPARILPEVAEIYRDRIEPRFEMEYAPRKIAVPDGRREEQPFAVLKSHIDTNHHVNNGKYVTMAEEYLPEGFSYKELRAEYLKAAVLGDWIYPSVREEKDQVTVVLSDESGSVYAVVEFLKRQE